MASGSTRPRDSSDGRGPGTAERWRWSGSCPPSGPGPRAGRAVGRPPLPGPNTAPRPRQEPFRVRISGPSRWRWPPTTLAWRGPNLSRSTCGSTRTFADYFNAAQLATGPVLAVAGNSPTFLGHRLWQETRVALFKQAVDDRTPPAVQPRVAGRLRDRLDPVRPLELLEESVAARAGPAGGRAESRCASTRATGCRPWRSCGCTRARCGAGTGPSTTRPTRPPAHRDAGPAGGADCDRHAGQRRLPARADPCPGPGGRRHDAASPSSRPTTTSTGRPSSAWPPSWPGRRGRGGPPGDVAAPTWYACSSPPPARPLGRGVPRGGRRPPAVIEARAARPTGAAWQRLAWRPWSGTWAAERALAAMLERYLEHQRAGQPVHSWPIPGPGGG